jgi:hypothetical protein
MLRLSGDPRARGRAQAALDPDRIADVRAAVRLRLGQAEAARHLDQSFLAAQREMTAAHVPELLEETAGIAEGFDIPEAELFAYLHLGTLADLARDGCSAWAVAAGPDGPLVVKNRDFRGEHVALQRVFLHDDPSRSRRLICVGSLGSPGAYSSGMNSDGLTLVDTQVATSDHAPGVLRYFLMTRLLADCATVPEALALTAAVPHAGGGTLVITDAFGAVAAVELGASALAIEQGGAWVARTNHFVSSELGATTIPDADGVGASQLRLAALRARVPGRIWTVREAQDMMAGHDARGPFCRHGRDGESRTISNVVFACGARILHFTEGFACSRRRSTVAFQ